MEREPGTSHASDGVETAACDVTDVNDMKNIPTIFPSSRACALARVRDGEKIDRIEDHVIHVSHVTALRAVEEGNR